MERKKKLIIACGSLQPELANAAEEINDVEVIYMEQDLHRYPDRMKVVLQKKLNKIDKEENIDRIILGYGLCSGGINGIKAPKQGLIVPRVHDCITLFLGSRDRYKELFEQNPGTYYLTKTWIDNQKDPLGQMENEYTEKVGREDAIWAMKQELKNYSNICFIDTGIKHSEHYRQRAKENARFFEKKYVEYTGENMFFYKIINGPYDDKNFVFYEPGQTITFKEFLK